MDHRMNVIRANYRGPTGNGPIDKLTNYCVSQPIDTITDNIQQLNTYSKYNFKLQGFLTFVGQRLEQSKFVFYVTIGRESY